MTKRKIKKHITKRKNAIKATKKIIRLRMTRKNKYKNKCGGEPFDEYKKAKIKGKLVSLLAKKNLFRRTLNNFIIQIKNGKNKLTDSSKNSKYIKKIEKSIENAVDSIIETIEMNKNLINTLITVTIEGKPVDKETYSLAKNPVTIYEFVSPVTVIFDNLTDIIPEKDIIKILNAYFLNGGNFNNLSSKLKESPFQHEIKNNE
jgi:hypothetical protein